MTNLPKTQQLIVFQEVVRCGGIRAAARMLGQTQPSVTKTMNELENLLGVKLLNRNYSGIELTEAGKVFHSYSHYVIKELKKAIHEVRLLDGKNPTEIAFGYSSLIGYTILPLLVNDIKQRFGDMHISLKEAQLSSLLPAMREGKLDFAIGTITPDMPIQDFHVVPLFDAHFSVVTSKESPFAMSRSIEELAQANWVLPETDMGYYNHINYELNEHALDLEKAIRTDSVITIFNLVEKSDFVTILAKAMAIPTGLENKMVEIDIDEKLPTAHYAIVWYKNRKPPSIMHILVEFTKQHCQQVNW